MSEGHRISFFSMILIKLLFKFGKYVPASTSWRFYHKILFKVRVGYWPNLRRPRSFTEKICWLKINYRDPRLPKFVDKLAVRDYVRRVVGDQVKLPKLIFVAESAEDIPFDKLPDKCVIKSSHGCGHLIFYEKFKTSHDFVQQCCRQWISKPYGTLYGEWAYQNIPRKIFGEELLVDEYGKVPDDYKVFVFSGKAKYIQVDFDRFGNHTRTFYERSWIPIEIMVRYPRGRIIPKPLLLDDMLLIAEMLAADLPFARVDLYLINGSIYFGELTLYPGSGLVPFSPREADFEFGKQIDICSLVDKCF